MDFVKAFIIGGIICAAAQILIDKTKLTNARILVLFVVLGSLLTGVGLYGRLVDFAHAGATVPLPGFGYLLAKGVMREVDNAGVSGIFTGALKATAGGITSAVIFGLAAALCFNSKKK